MEPAFTISAAQAIARCRALALHTEEPGFITRTFLSPPMHAVHADVKAWMQQAGLSVHVDAAGNIRGLNAAAQRGAPRLIIGSHLDTVPHAGAFDGILGVLLGIALAEYLADLKMGLEVVGFSEEEGVRFGCAFIGSRALVGEIDDSLLSLRDSRGILVSEAIRAFGLDPSQMGSAQLAPTAFGYLELHIEQGPVLEHLGLPLGVVEAVAGQSRWTLHFEGMANHAGTTPMHLRRDALAGAAEFIGMVEQEALVQEGLVATVGRVAVSPGASNVIAASAEVSLDVRHAEDPVRRRVVDRLLNCARSVATRRGLNFSSKENLDQLAAPMDAGLSAALAESLRARGHQVHAMPSGAGHDATVLARKLPAAMLFLRSPGGVSHHPDETVLEKDVAAALEVGAHFLKTLEYDHV